ncbi:MAG: hypothetical protein ACE5ER_02625, partial [Nitrospinaceae bacterium]
VYEKSKGRWISAFGQAFGNIFGGLGKFDPTGVGGLIKKGFDGLAEVQEGFTSSGFNLQPLPHDQALELAQFIHAASQKNLVLILDQWERTDSVEKAGTTLQAFLSHLEDWPPMHIFLTLRREGKALDWVEERKREFSTRMEHYELPLLDFSDKKEKEGLLNYLHEKVPFSATCEDDAILDLIGGHPEVLRRWVDKGESGIGTYEELKSLADDAHHFRYEAEISTLGRLQDGQRAVVLRLALLPPMEENGWKTFKEIILGDQELEIMDGLKRMRILEEVMPPDLGHAKRREALTAALKDKHQIAFQTQAETVIKALGERAISTEPRVVSYILALGETYPRCKALNLPAWAQAAGAACKTLFRVKIPELSETLVAGARSAAKTYPSLAPLFAMGLFNTLVWAHKDGDRERRDDLLAELRRLYAQHFQDTAVRKQLSMGLFNTLAYAREEGDLERRDALLAELRRLYAQHSQDTAVRKQLSMGLFNSLNNAREERDLERRDDLLEELRGLYKEHPADPAFRNQLARGLANTLHSAKEEGDLERRDDLLEELRGLYAQNSEDLEVRKWLAHALYVAFGYAHKEMNWKRRNSLVVELEGFCSRHPGDPTVQKINEMLSDLISALE